MTPAPKVIPAKINNMREQEILRLTHSCLTFLHGEKLRKAHSLIESMLDPVSRALAAVPLEDELISEEEERAVAESREWLKTNKGIPFEDVVAELGLTM